MKVVSLFSGAGGFDLGLEMAGHKIIWACDIDEDAAKTYEINFGLKVDTRSISDIPSDDIPDADLIVGGFPCQGFSVANWNRTVGDPRNSLYKEMVRIIADKQPKYFIAENVKGLASMQGGKVLENIKKDFEDIGYRVSHEVLNSADYGVPQKRFRLIVLGVRSDITKSLSFPPTKSHIDPEIGEKSGLPCWISVGQALQLIPEPNEPHDLLNHTGSQYKLRFNGHIGHRFIDANQPAPTVTARGDNKGGVVVIHHPNNHRRMTVRELATVQSFPLDFAFYGPNSTVYRQIGNAVPPLMAKAIGEIFNSTERKVTKNASPLPKELLV